MKKIIINIFLLSALLFSTAFAQSSDLQEDYRPHQWWINFGLGTGLSATNTNSTLKTSGAGQLSFNGMITSKLFFTLATTGVSNSGYNAHDTGVLLGYKCKEANWYWSLAAGIAHREIETSSRWYYGYDYSYQKGPVIPVQIQLFWLPVRHVGLGLVSHTVLAKHPYSVALLSVQLS
jgi:hypothetical protein